MTDDAVDDTTDSGVPKRFLVPLREGRPHPAVPESFLNLNLRDAMVAPSLGQAPVRRALLAATFDLFSQDPAYDDVGPGRVHLLTPDGQWRRLNYDNYGYQGPFHTESAFALSPRGTKLAMAEGNQRAIVVVDLPTNSHRRYRIPVRQAIRLRWSPDQSKLTFVRRHTISAPDPGFELDLATGGVKQTPYEAYFSDYANARRNVLEVGRDSDGSAVINTYVQSDHHTSQPLEYDLLGTDPKVGPRYLAYNHRTRARDRARGAMDGIVVVDPANGKLRTMLADKNVRRTWTQNLDWLTEQKLAFTSSRPSVVKLWNIDTGRIRVLADFENQGVVVSLARRPAAELIKQGTS